MWVNNTLWFTAKIQDKHVKAGVGSMIVLKQRVFGSVCLRWGCKGVGQEDHDPSFCSENCSLAVCLAPSTESEGSSNGIWHREDFLSVPSVVMMAATL